MPLPYVPFLYLPLCYVPLRFILHCSMFCVMHCSMHCSTHPVRCFCSTGNWRRFAPRFRDFARLSPASSDTSKPAGHRPPRTRALIPCQSAASLPLRSAATLHPSNRGTSECARRSPQPRRKTITAARYPGPARVTACIPDGTKQPFPGLGISCGQSWLSHSEGFGTFFKCLRRLFCRRRARWRLRWATEDGRFPRWPHAGVSKFQCHIFCLPFACRFFGARQL
jgi:hypothetical protein